MSKQYNAQTNKLLWIYLRKCYSQVAAEVGESCDENI